MRLRTVKRRRRARPAPAQPNQSHRLRDVSAAVALAGLLVALLFNTIGVWQQVKQAELGVRQADETRRAAELEVLTQLNAAAAASDRAVNATEAWDRRCDEITVQTLDSGDEARIINALEHYDYLAFLVERKHVTMQEARRYWERDMIEAYAIGSAFIDPVWLETHYLHLKDFYDRAPRSLRPRCP